MMKKLGIAALILAIMLTAGACQRNNNGAPDDTPPAGTPGGGAPAATPGGTATPGGGAANVNAEAIYQAQCMACHAADLSGGAGPKLNDIGSRMSDEDIAGVVSNGRGGMPAFKGRLTDEEIHGLSSWLASQKG